MISVLVPVYNVEKYLPRCLDSLLRQTFTDYEIVLVDDGSTDASGQICDAYAEKHGCIRVIHQENAGLAQVRNVSVAAARGEYVTFVDSDDAAEPRLLEVLMQDLLSSDSDVAICSWSEIGDDGGRRELTWDGKEEGFRVWNMDEAVRTLLYQKGIDNNTWGKLYRREVLSGIEFPAGRIYEDLAVMYRVLLNANRVCYRPEALYLYTCNTSGISQSAFTPRRMDLIDMAEKMYQDVKSHYPAYVRAAESRLLRAYMHVYLWIPGDEQYRTQTDRVLKGIRSLCRTVASDTQAKRGTRMAAMIACVHPALLRALNRWKKFAK